MAEIGSSFMSSQGPFSFEVIRLSDSSAGSVQFLTQNAQGWFVMAEDGVTGTAAVTLDADAKTLTWGSNGTITGSGLVVVVVGPGGSGVDSA